ncbi:hypothetical protein [Desulfosarcina ovata]|uniref:CopG family transcriptional regulator n=1 Tax=Desulfosarcina ovata subsp. ovata TaxID=2752305 RepID=A0A5K8AB34_9BACT|nr:hypothetical protein [Desulfosarcina ovata]BBO89923.1 hypothetical protein DSCOOX_31030 [Desulfosarcina ovata subsp. ovata]
MARPKKDEKKIQYTVMIEPSVIEEIKILAEKAELPTGTFARNLLMLGLEDARVFDKAGIIKLVGTSRKQMDKIKKKFGLTLDGLDVLNKD